jgi:hypothetical protein
VKYCTVLTLGSDTMGLRTELQVDGDRCKRCKHQLYKWGRNLGFVIRYRDRMRILVARVSCQWCNAVTEIEYFGELLPTRHMREEIRRQRGYPSVAKVRP